MICDRCKLEREIEGVLKKFTQKSEDMSLCLECYDYLYKCFDYQKRQGRI